MKKQFTKIPRILVTCLIVGLSLFSTTNSYGQLFRQDFAGAAVSASTVTSRTVLTGDYVDPTTPGTSKWDYIAVNGKSQTGIAINATANAGTVPFYTGGMAAGGTDNLTEYVFSRTTPLASTSATAIKITFNMKCEVTSGNSTAPGKFFFQVGSGFAGSAAGLNSSAAWSTANSSTSQGKELDANVFAGFSLAYISTNAAIGATLLKNDGVLATPIKTALGTAFNTWTIVMNNSGASLNYSDPNSATEAVADNSMDIWIGTTKVGDDIAAVTASQTLDNFKFGEFAVTGKGRTTWDWIQIDDITPASCVVAPSISAQPATGGETVGQGGSASALSITAVGVGTTTYQWYGSDDAVNNTAGDDVNVGTSSNTCNPPTTTIGTKYYYCVATNGCGSTSSDVSGAIVVTAPVPTVALTTGSNTTSVMESYAMTSAVYTYSNVSDANATAAWDASAPSGLSFSQNTTDKTWTLSGTPALSTSGTYNYTVAAVGGNTINGSVTITAYVTPTPTITAPSNKNQALKAGVAIADMAFTLTNATGASVTGLPTGLSGSYLSGTYTISGTIDGGVAAGSFPYTVTATPMAGYVGSDITSTGTIVVKSATAKNILYLASDATTTLNDLFLAQLTNSIDYVVTKRLNQANFVGNYDGIDLIILHESLNGGDAATTTNELFLVKSMDKPILNLKSYVYTGGTTPRWNWGTPNNGNSGKGVKVIQPSHPIFSGITISDSLYIYGSLRAKNIQPTTSTIGGYQLAKVNGGIAIHEVPASIRLTSGTSKYVMVVLLNGAFSDLTADALKLLDNSVNYLLTGTQFAAPSLEISSFNVNSVAGTIDNALNTINTVLPIEATLTALEPVITLAGTGTSVSPVGPIDFSNSYNIPINYTVSDGINSKVYAVKVLTSGTGVSDSKLSGITFNGKTLLNDAHIQLNIFDISGRLVLSSNQNVNTNSMAKGIYLVKTSNSTIKISVIK